MNTSAQQDAVTCPIRTKPSRATALSRTMSGMIQDVYGPPDVLSIRDIAEPALGAHVHARRLHRAGRHYDLVFDNG
jgi:hypothetical protein